jgi:hypothetical protein
MFGGCAPIGADALFVEGCAGRFAGVLFAGFFESLQAPAKATSVKTAILRTIVIFFMIIIVVSIGIRSIT